MLDDWINMKDHPPTDDDADPWNCIMVWHEYQGCMVTGIRSALDNSFVTHWKRTPPMPEELRKKKEEKQDGENPNHHNQHGPDAH